ncbi:type II toxin-antitoxin system RelB/DinJ family antitoxin [Acidovorax sp. CCYZU-2555]|uniref:type II toxin-antitoxin system RelB/DinJ family antitoxin n=1 Tax=Acidovorax sp. CCYZU-2555 TaxID=2835042 RepID=UPI001BCEED19|nr:type II toxin-antitoxin system RelB/DinJ family antitoxin [Acidovorax sp. CCYZU-2555]MBS7778009.1 type II toxin-antitoxin system RelB/DinJ family antitoxin [Acidovorax sp. CCYZU-2555]
MASTSMVHFRVDEALRAQATETLAAMGLTVSDAVRLFLTRVVAEQELPFALKVPNAATQAAMQEAGEIIGSRRARFENADTLNDALEKASRQQTA